MPLTWYQIRNEYGLADLELFRAVDKDDPEALLEGVAMAGLVGILRQLGDLAEFAAEMFHDLHEHVLATAARGHGLMFRVQQLEAEFPSVEKAFLSQTDHSSFFSNTGVDWHPNLQMEQNLVACGVLPRCVMDSYEECRGPPRLFLLDKFDVAGTGTCLKRYTDPSFFKLETPSSETLTAEVQREKKSRKPKKKRSGWSNGVMTDTVPTSHAKLHQLFLEERVESGHTNPTRLVKLKTRKLSGSPLNSMSGRSYMEKFLQTSLPGHNTGSEIASKPQLLTWNADDSKDSGIEIPKIHVLGAVEKSCHGTESEASPSNEKELVAKPSTGSLSGDVIDRDIETVLESIADDEADRLPFHPRKMIVEKEIGTDKKGKLEGLLAAKHSEDLTTEVESYMDALAIMESEMETDFEGRPRKESGFLIVGKHDTGSGVDEEQMEISQEFSDTQSIGDASASDNEYSSFCKERTSFSYSDTVSISSGNEPSDGEEAAELLPSTGTCEAELVGSSFNHLPTNNDVPGSDSNDLETVNGRDAVVETSCSSHCTYSSLTRLLQNIEECSPSTQPVTRDTSLERDRLDPEKLSHDKSGMNLVDSSTRGVSSLNTLDGGDPSFSSGPLQKLTNLSDSAPEEKESDTTMGNAHQTNCENDTRSENLMNVEAGSTHPVIRPIKDLFSPLARPEMSSEDVLHAVGRPIPAAKIHLENTSPLDAEADNILAMRGVPENDTEISAAELIWEDPSRVGTEADKTIKNIDEVDLEKRISVVTEVYNSALASEISSEDKIPASDTSPTSNLVCGQLSDASLKPQSNYPDDEDLGNQVAVSTADATGTGENMQESFTGTGKLYHKGLESNGTLSSGFLSESDTKVQKNQLEVASADSDTISFESASDIPSSQEISDGLQHSSPVEPFTSRLAVDDAPSLLTSSNLSDAVESGPCALPECQTSLYQSIEVKTPKKDHPQANESTFQFVDLEPEKISCLDLKDQDKCVNASTNSSPEALPHQGFSSGPWSQPADQEFHSSKPASSLECAFSSFGLLPEATQTTNMEEMPPLPPLPPMQWRTGKFQHSVPASRSKPIISSQTPFLVLPPFAVNGNDGFSFTLSGRDGMQPLEGKTDQFVYNMGQLPSTLSRLPTMVTNINSQYNGDAVDKTWSVNPFLASPIVTLSAPSVENATPVSNITQSTLTPSLSAPSAKNATPSQDPISSQKALARPQNQLAPDKGFQDEAFERSSQNVEASHNLLDTTASFSLSESTKVAEKGQLVSPGSEGETLQPSNSSTRRTVSSSVGDAMWPVNAFALAPSFDAERPIETPAVKLTRPRSPLVDAVAAHNRSTLRKVSEGFRYPIEPKIEEKNLWLAQIRNKSFNLKTAVGIRPSLQGGPKTNLKLAAILEKANTIRQAMAGSDEDEDEDEDVWSDS